MTVSTKTSCVNFLPPPWVKPEFRSEKSGRASQTRRASGSTAGQPGWAEVGVVMEKRHKERWPQKFLGAFAAKPCVCFFISDDCEFMDAALVEILHEKMQEHFPATK